MSPFLLASISFRVVFISLNERLYWLNSAAHEQNDQFSHLKLSLATIAARQIFFRQIDDKFHSALASMHANRNAYRPMTRRDNENLGTHRLPSGWQSAARCPGRWRLHPWRSGSRWSTGRRGLVIWQPNFSLSSIIFIGHHYSASLLTTKPHCSLSILTLISQRHYLFCSVTFHYTASFMLQPHFLLSIVTFRYIQLHFSLCNLVFSE